MSDLTGGYTGRVLRVDLSTSLITVVPTPDVTKWLGPRGWNAWIAWNEVAPGVGPFDPENRMVLSAGPLVGTAAPTAGRLTISSVSPRSYPEPAWTSSSMGGYLGAEIKYAGYDAVVVHGRAQAPCYLLIEDDRITLENATELWGMGAYGSQTALKARHSLQHQIATIGQAGENLVRYACILHRLNNAAGNTGFGAVMGAKRLKAIVVRGTGGVRISDPTAFHAQVKRTFDLVRGGLMQVGQVEEGYPSVACTHGCSVRCWTRVHPVTVEVGESVSPVSMTTCVEGAIVGDPHPGYKGTHPNGMTLSIPSPPGLGEAGYALTALIEDLGLSAWVYETWYRYLGALRDMGYTEVLGTTLDLDSAEWWRGFLVDIATRRGLGDACAEDLARFYDKHRIGPPELVELLQSAGSRGHGWHRDGRAMEPHPSPFWEHAALLYAVSTRDVSPSTHGFLFFTDKAGAKQSLPKHLERLAEQVYGSREAVAPGDALVEQVTVWHQHRAVIKDSMSVCDWVFPVLSRTVASSEDLQSLDSIVGDLAAEAKLYTACTGINMSIQEMESPVAERIVTLERCVDVRNHGRNRAIDEAVIPHFQWPEKVDGTHIAMDGSDFRALLDRYYALRGWDLETGIPTRERLVELGLEDVAASLLYESQRRTRI